MTVSHIWSGNVSSSGCTVLCKATGTSVSLLVADNPQMSSPTRFGPETPDSQDVVTFDVTGLDPDTTYWYVVEEGGAPATDLQGQFRTHATLGDEYSFTIAVGCCAGENTEYPAPSGLAPDRVSNHPVFDTIRASKPLLFVHLGDMHYYDPGSGKYVSDASVTTYRDAYDSVHACTRQSALYRSTPIVYLWDDHDYGPNNSDGTFTSKANASQVYRERVPSYELAEPSGSIYHSFQIGRVLFVASDTRYNRSPNSATDNSSKTMLGSTQKTWLENLLTNTDAEALVWLMPTPWMGLASDTWAGFTTERGELVEMLGDTGWLDRMCMFNGDYHGLAMDRGSGNDAGGFPVYVVGALDSGDETDDPTTQYDTGPTKPGRNHWGQLRVVDRGYEIGLTGVLYIGNRPWRVNTQTITTSTSFSTTFPAQPAPWKVEIAPGGNPSDPSTWNWEDITSYVRQEQGVTISGGRADEWGETGTTTCDLTLDNRDGRFSPRNINGAWYGKLARNTPLRVSWDGVGERFVGYVTEWPPRWDKSGRNAHVPIQATGVLRRLAQGAKPLQSPMRRAILSAANETRPIGYWPCEDDEDASVLASAIPNVQPLRIKLGPGWSSITTPDPDSKVTLKSDLGPAGSNGGIQMPYGWFVDSGVLAPPKNLTAFSVEWIQNESAESNQTVLYVQVNAQPTDERSPSYYRLDIDERSIQLLMYNEDIGTVHLGGYVRDVGSYPHHCVATFEQTGVEEVICKIYVNGVLHVEDNASVNLSAPYRLVVSSKDSTKTAEAYLSHAAIWPYALTLHEVEQRHEAFKAYVGETAGDRIARLCAEEGIPYFPISGGVDTMAMGPQEPGTLLELLRSAEAADGGLLFEQSGGLSYLARTSRYNPEVKLTVSIDDREVAEAPEPVDDDQRLRNDVTVQRSGGSSARVADEASIATVGVYDEQLTLNVESDDVLRHIAGWRVRLGTADEMRWPSLALNLARGTHLIPKWLSFRLGDRLVVNHNIEQLAGVPIDTLVEGWSETFDSFTWRVDLNTVPSSPWTVGVLGDDKLGRLDTDGSQVAVAVGDASPLNSNTGFETDLEGWFASGSGVTLTRSQDQAHSGSWSALLTPSGSAATAEAGLQSPTAPEVTPGKRYTWSVWVYSPGGDNVTLAMSWRDASNNNLGNVNSGQIAVPAGEWARLAFTAEAPTSAARCSARVWLQGTPAAADILYIDDAELTEALELDVFTTAGPTWVEGDTDDDDFPFDIKVDGEVMTVSGVGPILQDTFDRTESNGWGTADTGQTWTTVNGSASDYSVSGGVGIISHSTRNVRRMVVTDDSFADVDIIAKVKVPFTPSGAFVQAGLVARFQDASNAYHSWIQPQTNGVISFYIFKCVGGTFTQLARYDIVEAHDPNRSMWIRFRVEGTRLSAMTWYDGMEVDRKGWHISVDDSEILLPGAVGVHATVPSTNTNTLPVQMEFSDLRLLTPQRFTVTRGVGTGTRSHDAGAEVRLAQPLILAL